MFTFPNSPLKCPGAPQKIMYIAEESFRKRGISANIHYYKSWSILFSCKKYEDALWEVVKGRGINVHLRENLVEIKPDRKEAIFENLDSKEKVIKTKKKNFTSGACLPSSRASCCNQFFELLRPYLGLVLIFFYRVRYYTT